MSTNPNRPLARLTLLATLCLAGGGAVSWLNAATARPEFVASAQSTSVAVVNIERVINELAERADQRRAFQERFNKREEMQKALVDQFNRIKSEIELLPEDDPTRLDRMAQLKVIEAQATAQRQALSLVNEAEHGRDIRVLYEKTLKTIADLAAKNGYDLVLLDDSQLEIPDRELTKDQIQTFILERRILHSGPRLDITDLVITQMNNDYAAGIRK